MANETVFNQHFDLLEKTISELALEKKPENTFNCDESMVNMDRRTGKVVVSMRTKQAYSESKGTRDHITVNACGSASSQVLPPHIIFVSSYPSGPYAREGPNGALYSIFDNGYMDSELFYGFLNQLFIPRTRHISGPELLILDGHGSHLDIKSIELCRNNFAHIYCLPPHTTHIFQPLDVVIFHPLKTHFSRLTEHVKLATLHWKNHINCNKTNFTKLFKEPWELLTTLLIKAGFRKCGVVPLDRNAIDKKRLVNSNCQDSLTNTCINDVSVSSSNNSSLLNTTPVEFPVSPQSSSTPPNPLVAVGIITATVYNSIIITAEKEETQKKPRLNRQARLITSDEQIRQYEEKFEKIC